MGLLHVAMHSHVAMATPPTIVADGFSKQRGQSNNAQYARFARPGNASVK
jgi:hypothetical protein